MGKVQAMCERMAQNSDNGDASIAGMLTSCSWISDVPRNYAFPPACYCRYIGVARLLSGVHFSSPKENEFFSLVLQIIR